MSDGKHYALEAFFGAALGDTASYTPHARHLGMRVVEMGPGFGVCVLPYRDELIGDPARRVVFGGAITTLLDHTSGLAVACALEVLRPIATIDLRVDYLRAAAPGVDLYARSECYHVTHAVAFVRAWAYERERDDPFASCLATFMLGANYSENPFEALITPDEPEGQ